MAGNNKNAAAAQNPIDELKRLENQLGELRDKQLSTLEKKLQDIEKLVESQKTKVEKARAASAAAKTSLDAKKGERPSIIQRAEASLAKCQARSDEEQEALAQLRSEAVALKLQIRKEETVRKAINDAEKSLTSPKTSNQAQQKPAKKAAVKTTAPKPQQRNTATKPPIKTSESSTSSAKKAKSATAAAPKNEEPAAQKDLTATTSGKGKELVAEPASKPATPPKKAAPPAPQRIVHRMSDIPSHPDKAEDRLASLFENF